MFGVTEFRPGDTGAVWWALPFLGLLLSIAIVPMAAPRHWLRHSPAWAASWTLMFVGPALIVRGAGPVATIVLGTVLHEYLPFILLLLALYVVTGGIHITGSPRPSAATNTAILTFGTLLAGLIGTIGAALLLIQPLIRINRGRPRQSHVYIFFIALVANIGGALSPLGNPPLLLGYLAGVPFLWPLRNLWQPTLILALGLLVTFFVIDTAMPRRDPALDPPTEAAKLGIRGGLNLILLPGVIAIVLLGQIWPGAPVLNIIGVAWRGSDIVSDLLYICIAFLSLRLTAPAVRAANDFGWAPIVEVGILFAAIFVTLIPVIGIIAAGAGGPAAPLVARLMNSAGPVNLVFYGATGLLSGFLDNAPTYLMFFDFAGGDPARLTGPLAVTLGAISAGASYFGALSYLGNAPNLMVKSMAEAHGVAMPGFFVYTGVAMLIAGPWFAVVGFLFFR